MSASYLEIDITLCLKEWAQCDLDYSRAINFCEGKAKSDQTNAENYIFCSYMLQKAKKIGATFYALDRTLQTTIFAFRFQDLESYQNFLYEISRTIKRHKVSVNICQINPHRN